MWIGAKYAVTDELDLIGGYHYNIHSEFGPLASHSAMPERRTIFRRECDR
jgi:hypothetical protein